jgi:hypothetical protein
VSSTRNVRRAAEFRVRGHTPAHHGEFALRAGVKDDGGRVVREHAGHRRQVTDVAAHHPESAAMAAWFVVIE